jgi:hypothetical protein
MCRNWKVATLTYFWTAFCYVFEISSIPKLDRQVPPKPRFASVDLFKVMSLKTIMSMFISFVTTGTECYVYTG